MGIEPLAHSALSRFASWTEE